MSQFTKTLILYLCFVNLLFSQVDFEYYHDVTGKLTVQDICKKEFISVTDKINNGLDNGVYWVKVHNNSTKTTVVEFSSSKLYDYIIYGQAKVKKNTVFPTFEILPKSNTLIKFNITKEALIPMAVFSEKEYSYYQVVQIFQMGLFYGFALMVVCINLFYFSSLKEYMFLYYVFFLMSVILEFLYRDGILGFVTHQSYLVHKSDFLLHLLAPITGVVFAGAFLQQKIFIPKLRYLALVFIIVSAICFLLYIKFNSFLWFAIADVVSISLSISYWIVGVYLCKQNPFAKFFCIAYFPMIILCFDYFISPLFGFPNFGITTGYLKMGTITEMLVLSYGIVYRMRFLVKQNSKIRNELYSYTQALKTLTDDLNSRTEHKNLGANLTPRQKEILAYITDGFTNKEIAEKLNISVNTVKYHIKIIYDELNVSSRKEIIQLKSSNFVLD